VIVYYNTQFKLNLLVRLPLPIGTVAVWGSGISRMGLALISYQSHCNLHAVNYISRQYCYIADSMSVT